LGLGVKGLSGGFSIFPRTKNARLLNPFNSSNGFDKSIVIKGITACLLAWPCLENPPYLSRQAKFQNPLGTFIHLSEESICKISAL